MFHSKSDTLDEFRYQIGRYGEQVTEVRELIDRIIRLLVSKEYIYTSACYYICGERGFHLYSQEGTVNREEFVPFDDNNLSLCAIRGSRQGFRIDDGIQICVPCYKGHRLLGQLVVNSDYEGDINEDDYDFLSEVVKYVKRKIVEQGKV